MNFSVITGGGVESAVVCEVVFSVCNWLIDVGIKVKHLRANFRSARPSYKGMSVKSFIVGKGV